MKKMNILLFIATLTTLSCSCNNDVAGNEYNIKEIEAR